MNRNKTSLYGFVYMPAGVKRECLHLFKEDKNEEN